MTELKFGPALDQHRLVVKVALRHLRQEVLRCGKEMGILERIKQSLMLAHFGPDAIESVYLLGSQQAAHLAIEHFRLDILGIEVAQDDCRAPVACTPHHEVDGWCQGDEVVGIFIGDDGAVIHALDDVDARAQRGQSHHALSYHIGCHAQVEHHRQAGDSIVHVHGIGHGQGERVLVLLIHIGDDRAAVLDLDLPHIQLLARIGLGPGDDVDGGLITLVEQGFDGFAHTQVVGSVDDALTVVQNLGLLGGLAVHVVAKLVLGLRCNVCHHTHCGPDHAVQPCHFARTRDAGFDDGQGGVIVDVPQ